jgi:hypothetical protein
VLKKRPVGRDVNDGDQFYFNPEFTHDRYQVRIDSIQAKETVCTILSLPGLGLELMPFFCAAGRSETDGRWDYN